MMLGWGLSRLNAWISLKLFTCHSNPQTRQIFLDPANIILFYKTDRQKFNLWGMERGVVILKLPNQAQQVCHAIIEMLCAALTSHLLNSNSTTRLVLTF